MAVIIFRKLHPQKAKILAHNTIKTSYQKLSDRINMHPQGATQSELLFQILKLLFSENEAQLVSELPLRPFTAEKAAKVWKLPQSESKKVLEELASRSILVDLEWNGEMRYVLPPPMAGFFEFSLMRVRKNLNQKLLSELFYQYMNVEDDFIRSLFTDGETQLGRTFVNEPALSADNALLVLDYERASEVIKTASHIGVGLCYCRHKMEHLGKACNAQQDICMTFNSTAESLIKHGTARSVGESECMKLLDNAYEHNLVQFGENVQRSVNFICNCCGCCCEAMIAARRFALDNPIHSTNFLPVVEESTCNACGKCVQVCPVEAMTLVSANDPHKIKRNVAKVSEDICLGCGVCVRACKNSSLSLKSRNKRVITPVDGVHKTVMMAVERGKLQNLIFDNQVLASHRTLAAVLGAILKLPPLKQVLANQQLRSRFVETMINTFGKV